jgi:CMP-N-acetylneuraminic acid synthetase
MKILCIIPARGGSKGIPRKNLRPLNNQPLIYYSINAAKGSVYHPDVYVTSEDDEILMFASRFGAKTYKRPVELADDKTTLDPVIHDAFSSLGKKYGVFYDFIITLQPTSPLLSSVTLDKAIQWMQENPAVDVLISAKEERHLSWKKEGSKYFPNYSERLNRQYLEPVFFETGAFVICKASILRKFGKRITGNASIFIVPERESIDIDHYEDWAVCEFYLKRKKVLFVLVGNNEVGLGHVYRAITLAHELWNHEVSFLLKADSRLAFEKIKESNFPARLQEQNDIVQDIIDLHPDIVINDILDTSESYIRYLKQAGSRVINFEDLGMGAVHADMVINALYPELNKLANHYFGHEYFCTRDEFINITPKKIAPFAENILISFGGVDPNNLTHKVLQAIYPACTARKLKVTVMVGMGYKNQSTLAEFKGIEVYQNVSNISEFFKKADIIFTSAGRTVYEIGCIGTPAIVLAQNERELTHFFAKEKYGFVNLGLGTEVKTDRLADAFIALMDDYPLRQKLNQAMLSIDLKNGKKRTVNLINELIQQANENN